MYKTPSSLSTQVTELGHFQTDPMLTEPHADSIGGGQLTLCDNDITLDLLQFSNS